jgi:hypothetical protein
MPPIAAVITFFSVTIPTAVAGALAIPLVAAQAIVGLGLSIGLSLAARALTPRQKPPGQQFEVKVGANVPLFTVYGRQKLAGLQMPPVQTSTKVYHVRALGLGELDALEAIIVDGKRCRFEGIAGQWTDAGAVRQSGMGLVDWSGNPVNPAETSSGSGTGDPPATPGLQGGASGSAWVNVVEFKRGSAARMRVKFYPGRQDQVADTTLPSVARPDAQGRKHWTSDHRLRGIAYVIVEIEPDSQVQLSAAPVLEFVVRGRKLLDPRKCAALGGTGSHLLDDPETWEWSDNVALCHFDYRRGVRFGAIKVFGVGTPLSRIHMPSVFAAINACDAPRALLGGGTEPMWRLAAVVSNDRPHRDNLQIFYDAMAGAETEVGGTFRIRAGALETPVATITDADLVKGPRRFRAQVPRMDRRNAVTGKFANPRKSYEIDDLPVRFSSADEAADGGERLISEMTLAQVPSATQGQHLMEIRRRSQRLTRTATITVPPRLRNPLVGEVISWQSDRWHGGGTYAYRIVSWRRNRNMTLTLGLAETAASIWPWVPDDDQLSILEAADLPSAAERLESVPGFAVVASSEAGEDGQVRPIFLVSWTPITDPSVKALIIRYRVAGSEAWLEQRISGAQALASGEGKIVSGVQAGTPYEFVHDLETLPTRVTEPVALPAPVVSSADHVVRTAVTAVTVAPGGVDWAALDAAMQERVEAVEQAASDAIAAAIAAVNSVQDVIGSLSGDATRAETAGARIGVQINQRLTSLSQALAHAIAVSEDMRGALGDLGWERRGPGGASRFRAVDTINNGLTALSTTVEMLAGRVDTIVAASGEGLEELDAELSVIRQTLDALEGLYEALVTTVNGTTGSVAQLQLRMDAVESTITLLATKAELGAIEDRLEAAELQLSAGTVTIETIAAIRQSQAVASQTLAELLARFQSLSDAQWEQAAATRFRLDSRIDDQGRSIATLQIELAALTANTAATFASLTTSIADQTSALTAQINTLSAQVNHAATGLPAVNSAINTLQTTKVDAAGATAVAQTEISTVFGAGSSGAKITLASQAAESGYSAYYQVRVFGGGTSAAMRFVVSSGNISGVDFFADRMRIFDAGGTPRIFFDATEGKIVADQIKVKDAEITGRIINDAGVRIDSVFRFGNRYYGDNRSRAVGRDWTYLGSPRSITPWINLTNNNLLEFYASQTATQPVAVAQISPGSNWPEGVEYLEILNGSPNGITRLWPDGQIEIGDYTGSATWVTLVAKSPAFKPWEMDPYNLNGTTKFLVDLPATICVPAGKTLCKAKLWAAGGWGGDGTASGRGYGGPGSYTYGEFAVTPGELLRVTVPVDSTRWRNCIGGGGQNTGSGVHAAFMGGRPCSQMTGFGSYGIGRTSGGNQWVYEMTTPGGGACIISRGAPSRAGGLILVAPGGGSAMGSYHGYPGGHPGGSGGNTDSMYGRNARAQISSPVTIWTGAGGGYEGGAHEATSAGAWGGISQVYRGLGGTFYAAPGVANLVQSVATMGQANPPNTSDPDYVAGVGVGGWSNIAGTVPPGGPGFAVLEFV